MSRTKIQSENTTETSSGKTRIEHPLEPIYDQRSRILMLGTLPSPKSREVSFYYGHPQNRFWKVMAKLFDEPLCQTNEERTNLLLKHHIALWDVVHSCDIEGASDASIAHVEPNDLTLITSTAPIQAIFCTGSKAAQLYRRYCEKNVGTPCIALPSTSPANAIWSLPDLLEAYRVILKYLDDRPTPSQLKGSQV